MFCHSCITLNLSEQGWTHTSVVWGQTSSYLPPSPSLPSSPGTALRAAGEGPSARGLQQQHSRCAKVFMRCKVSYYSLQPLQLPFLRAKEFSLNPKEKYMSMDFYDLKSVLAIDLSPFLALKKPSWKALLPNTALYGRILYCTRQRDEQSPTACLSFKSRRQTAEKGSWHLCTGVLRLYYSCYTNKLFRPCLQQIPAFGEINGRHVSPHTSGVVRCNLTYIPKMWDHLLPIEQNCGY